MIEITSPVGSYESLQSAIQGGATSVYFGVDKHNMRSASTVNFTLDDLNKISQIAKQNNLKTYITLNSVIYSDEIQSIKTIIEKAKENNIDAIIASDFAVIDYARKVGIDVHCSTQCNISNIEAVRFFSKYAEVMVLARELNLQQIKYIADKIREEDIKSPSGNTVKLEVFVHGALCMAVSGKCYLSLHNMNASANRGECLQLCRRPYLVKDKDGGYELEIDNEYIMSPKDLCTIDFLDKIIGAGVSILKIEGRGRSPEYVKKVTECYVEAVKVIEKNNYTDELINSLKDKLKSVYNRGFWEGYYLGKKTGEWTERYGSQATTKKVYTGKITNYFSNIGIAEIKVETGSLKVGDNIYIIGPTTGVYETKVKEIRVDLINKDNSVKGELCSIPVDVIVRRSDKLYKIVTEQDKD